MGCTVGSALGHAICSGVLSADPENVLDPSTSFSFTLWAVWAGRELEVLNEP